MNVYKNSKSRSNVLLKTKLKNILSKIENIHSKNIYRSCALSCKLTTNKKFPRFGNLGSFPSSAQEFPRKCAKVYKVSKSVQNNTLLEMNQFFAVIQLNVCTALIGKKSLW